MSRILAIVLLFGIVSCSEPYDGDGRMDAFFYADVNGSQMPVLVEGNIESKKFIVIVHGGPGGSGFSYVGETAIEKLEQDFAVVYYDQRLSGGSADVGGENPYPSRSDMANDLYHLIKTLKAKYGAENQMFLLGHSWGGELLGEFMSTTEYATEVAGMIHVAGLIVYADDYQVLGQNRRDLILSICDTVQTQDTSGAIWDQIEARVLAYDTVTVNKWNLGTHWQDGWDISWEHIYDAGLASNIYINETELYDFAVNIDGSSYESASGSYDSSFFQSENTAAYLVPYTVQGRTNQSYDITKIDKPSLIITGKYDCIVPPETGVRLYNDIATPMADKYYHEIDSTSHAPYRRAPEFYKLVKEFVGKY
ncbi:MAG: alpha/beta fold hydrolase [Bacteroidia bacterium]